MHRCARGKHPVFPRWPPFPTSKCVARSTQQWVAMFRPSISCAHTVSPPSAKVSKDIDRKNRWDILVLLPRANGDAVEQMAKLLWPRRGKTLQKNWPRSEKGQKDRGSSRTAQPNTQIAKQIGTLQNASTAAQQILLPTAASGRLLLGRLGITCGRRISCFCDNLKLTYIPRCGHEAFARKAQAAERDAGLTKRAPAFRLQYTKPQNRHYRATKTQLSLRFQHVSSWLGCMHRACKSRYGWKTWLRWSTRVRCWDVGCDVGVMWASGCSCGENCVGY